MESMLNSNPVSQTPLEIRLSLFENGYFPVLARGKVSDVSGWRTPVSSFDEVIALSQANPGYLNTGLLCGNLVAIDIDTPDPETASAILDMGLALPSGNLALRRVGKAPKVTLLFRNAMARKKIATKAYRVNGMKCQVEVMGDGQQVIGFGIHPDTLAPYQWIGATPLDVPFADLPEIDGAAIESFVADAEAYLAAHGELIVTAKATKPAQVYKPTEQRAAAGDGIWAELKAKAMANLGAWVPDLGLSGTKTYERGYLARADFRASTSSKGLSGARRGLSVCFAPEGIVDYADGDRGYNPIDITAVVLGIDPSEAADWLRARLGDERPTSTGFADALIANARTKKPAAAKYEAANDNEQEDDDVEEYEVATVEQSSGLAEHLCFPPGAVGDFARFIVDCARFPSPHLALVSALSLTAGLIGRRYKGPTKLRSNLYAVGLAESGFGKDITIRAAAAIADSTELGSKVSQSIFMDKIRSMPGIASKLRKSPSTVAVVDEFGTFLKTIAGDNLSEVKDEIRSALMELTGAPMGYWGGMEKASGNIPRIVQPCFSIHGISTPTTFWEALSSGNISEGLLGRLVLVDVGGADPVKVMRPKSDIENVPAYLSQHVSNLIGSTNATGAVSKYSQGPFCALSASSESAPYPMITADWQDESVHMMFEEFDNEIRSRKRKVDPKFRPILNRVAENAGRLALIVAVGCDHKNPVITREIQEWANTIAENALQVVMSGASENIADNQLQREYMRVRNIIGRSKKKGVTHSRIIKTIGGAIQNRRIDDILDNLRKGKDAHYATWLADSGQTQMRYWLPQSLPKGATIHSPWG